MTSPNSSPSPAPSPMPVTERTGTTATASSLGAPKLEQANTFSSVISATPSILVASATLTRADEPPPDHHREILGDSAAPQAHAPQYHLAIPGRASPRLSPRVPLPGEEGHFAHADADFELGGGVAGGAMVPGAVTGATGGPPSVRRGSTPNVAGQFSALDSGALEAGHRPPTPSFRASSPPPMPGGIDQSVLMPPRPATPISSWLESQTSPLEVPLDEAGSPTVRPTVVPVDTLSRKPTPGDDYVPYDLDHHIEGDNADMYEHGSGGPTGPTDIHHVGHDLTSKGKMSGDVGGGAERTRRYLVKKKPMAKDAIASIFHTHHPPSKSDFCMRIIPKTALTKNSVGANTESLRKSSELWADLDHPQIVKLFDWWESDIEFAQILTLTAGGRLIDRIKKYGHFPERDAAIIMATLANTTSYLHALKIIHRDIRADNILYKDADPESIMYLGYFDLATPVPEGSAGVKGEVGAIANAAPEILRRQAYSYPADCWSLGIIAYQLLCGTHPFVSGKGTLGETFDAILAADPPFEGAVWALVSPEGKEFVKRLLDPNPATRMTAEEVFDSEWIQLYAPRTYLEWLKSITARHTHMDGHQERVGVGA